MIDKGMPTNQRVEPSLVLNRGEMMQRSLRSVLIPACVVAIVLTSGQIDVVLPSTAAADDWPQFRGPDGQGHSEARGLPLTWSETENMAWKVTIPGLGWPSPVVQDDKVWLTTALDDGRSLRLFASNERAANCCTM